MVGIKMKNRLGALSFLIIMPLLNAQIAPVLAQESAVQQSLPSTEESTGDIAKSPEPEHQKSTENQSLPSPEEKTGAIADSPAPEHQKNSEEDPRPDQKVRITFDAKPDDMPVLRGAQDQNPSQLDRLSNEILGYEIELLKLNTNFRMKSTDKNRIKPWRTFLYNLGGSGVATAGITTIAAERWRTWRKPATASRTALKSGPIMLLTSHSIITGGILLEATLDLLNDHKIKKSGFDTKSTKKRALELVRHIDVKLKEREALLAGLNTLSQEERALALEETPVLNDMGNAALSEYLNFHVRAKKRIASRNFAYLNGFSAATTGGYLGSLCGLLAISCRKPRLAGPAGLGFTISGANIATGPELGRLVGNCAGSLDKRFLKKEFGVVPKSRLAEHLTALRQHSSSSGTALAKRLSIYDSADGVLKRQAVMNANEKKKADREYIERCLFNAAIGGSKMSWGIQLMNAGYGFSPAVAKAQTPKKTTAKATPNPIAKFFPAPRARKTQAQLFAQRVAQGATSYIPGTSLWIVDTLQSRTRGEMDLYTMGQQVALPHQKLSERMSKITDMETKLKEISP